MQVLVGPYIMEVAPNRIRGGIYFFPWYVCAWQAALIDQDGGLPDLLQCHDATNQSKIPPILATSDLHSLGDDWSHGHLHPVCSREPVVLR